MNLIKTSLLNAIAVAIKVVSALVVNKILAIYVGPAGYAVIGQFQNAVSILISLAGGLLASGVTKKTAEHFDDTLKQLRVWQTAFRFSLYICAIAGMLLFLFADYLSQTLLHQLDMTSIFFWLALSLPAMAINSLLMAILNGKKEIGLIVVASIVGSLLNLLVTGAFAYFWGLYGALLAFVINPAVVLFITSFMIARREWFKWRFLWGGVDKAATKSLSGFALMGLTSALMVPTSYMLIRDFLSGEFGLIAAGYWQASWKISELYLMLVTTTLAVYYLPKLAEIRTAAELKQEVLKVYAFVLPTVMVCAGIIYLLRDWIIRLLFTEEFYGMRDLFAWQLFGDVLKIGSWILGYIMVGRAMVKAFVITEVIFCLSFFGLTCLLAGRYGLVGVSMAYALNYACYWVLMVFLVRGEMRRMAR